MADLKDFWRLGPHVRDILGAADVHLGAEELGLVAAALLGGVRLSSVLRSFVDHLTPDQRADLREYMETGRTTGLYWSWHDPLILSGSPGVNGSEVRP